MINIAELQTKLFNILNGYDSETSSIENPINNFSFMVQTYASHLNNIADKTLLKNKIPVFIANESGTVSPIPNLNETDTTFDIVIFFPTRFKDSFFKLPQYLVNLFCGKILDYGALSGKAVCNLSVPQLGEVERQQLKEFEDFFAENYKLAIDKTELWGRLDFQLYCHQVGNLGLANGFIVGNQITSTISFTYNGITYTENCVKVSSARSYNADITSQQLVNGNETLGIAKNSSSGDGLQVYIRDNEFWNEFLDLYENGLLQNIVFTYTKTYNLVIPKTYTKEMIINQCPTEDQLGIAKTFSFQFIKKASVI